MSYEIGPAEDPYVTPVDAEGTFDDVVQDAEVIPFPLSAASDETDTQPAAEEATEVTIILRSRRVADALPAQALTDPNGIIGDLPIKAKPEKPRREKSGPNRRERLSRAMWNMYFKFDQPSLDFQEEFDDSSLIGKAVIDTALAVQLLDRLRVPESLSIPFAVHTYESTGSIPKAMLALLVGVALGQTIIGGSTGYALHRFPKTIESVNKEWHWTETLAETINEKVEGKSVGSRMKRFMRNGKGRGFLGLWAGNTPFVVAEKVAEPDTSLLETEATAVGTSLEIGSAAALLGGAVLELQAQFPTNRFVNNYLVGVLKNPKWWIAAGAAAFSSEIATAAKNKWDSYKAAKNSGETDDGTATGLTTDPIA